MIWKIYWFLPIVWWFGSWKTFLAYRIMKEMKKKWALIISNVPYDFSDIYYNSKDDLYGLLQFLYDFYIEEENNPPFYIPLVVLFIDELHLYFYSRNFWKNFQSEKILTLLSQLRKRNILLIWTTQYILNVDTFIRRNIDYVLAPRYFSFFWALYYKICQWLDREKDIYYDDDSETVYTTINNWFLEKIDRIYFTTKIDKKYYPLTNFITNTESVLKGYNQLLPLFNHYYPNWISEYYLWKKEIQILDFKQNFNKYFINQTQNLTYRKKKL